MLRAEAVDQSEQSPAHCQFERSSGRTDIPNRLKKYAVESK
jgi:hypothetical protein